MQNDLEQNQVSFLMIFFTTLLVICLSGCAALLNQKKDVLSTLFSRYTSSFHIPFRTSSSQVKAGVEAIASSSSLSLPSIPVHTNHVSTSTVSLSSSSNTSLPSCSESRSDSPVATVGTKNLAHVFSKEEPGDVSEIQIDTIPPVEKKPIVNNEMAVEKVFVEPVKLVSPRPITPIHISPVKKSSMKSPKCPSPLPPPISVKNEGVSIHPSPSPITSESDSESDKNTHQQVQMESRPSTPVAKATPDSTLPAAEIHRSAKVLPTPDRNINQMIIPSETQLEEVKEVSTSAVTLSTATDVILDRYRTPPPSPQKLLSVERSTTLTKTVMIPPVVQEEATPVSPVKPKKTRSRKKKKTGTTPTTISGFIENKTVREASPASPVKASPKLPQTSPALLVRSLSNSSLSSERSQSSSLYSPFLSGLELDLGTVLRETRPRTLAHLLQKQPHSQSNNPPRYQAFSLFSH